MPALRTRLFKALFRYRNSRLPLDRPIPEQRRAVDARGRLLPMAPGMAAARVDAYGTPAEWVDRAGGKSERAFLYLHGGGYFNGSCRSHRNFTSHVAAVCRARLLLPEYRLAPEHPFPAGLLDARAAYRFLLAQGYSPDRIVVGGESSGGGLTLALLLTLRDEEMPMPAGAVLLSPWTDLLGTGESVRTRAACDPWLRPAGIPLLADRYRGRAPADHCLVSPLYGDLRGLPPMLVHVGSDEILLDDATRLAARAASAGAEVSLKVWEGLWHSFHLFFPFAPEARRAHKEIGEWFRSRTELDLSHAKIIPSPNVGGDAPLGGPSQPRAAAAAPGRRVDRRLRRRERSKHLQGG